MQQDSEETNAATKQAVMNVHTFTDWEIAQRFVEGHQNQQIELIFEDPIVSFRGLASMNHKDDFVETVLTSLAYKAWGHDVVKVISAKTEGRLSAQVTLDGRFDDDVAKLGDEDGGLKGHYNQTLLQALGEVPGFEPASESGSNLEKLAGVDNVERGSIVVELWCTSAAFLVVAFLFALSYNSDGSNCCLTECCFRNKGRERAALQLAIRRRLTNIEYQPDGSFRIQLQPERSSPWFFSS